MARRDNVPSHYRIFSYWKDKYITKNGNIRTRPMKDWKQYIPVVEDWGEPCCWGCGKYIEIEQHLKKYEEHLENNNLQPIYSNSYIQKRLQRAHIVPHMLGGTDTDPSNFFLLCSKCHKESPDTKYRKAFFKWIYQKRTYDNIFLHNLNLARQAVYALKRDFDININNISDIPIEESFENMGNHASQLSDSTIVSSIVFTTLEKINQGEK